MDQQFTVIVLAAGGSQRLGRPKQLLPYLGRTLIEHAARTALASGAAEVLVVVGAHADLVREKLANLPVRIVVNRDWQSGMASSIRLGVGAVHPSSACAVMVLCDQPRITPLLIRDLALRQFESDAPIVAAEYDGIVGVPCAFSRELFPRLKDLSGEAGAREIIRGSGYTVERVPFSGGNIDVDTLEDYRQLVPDAVIGEPESGSEQPSVARAPPRS